MASSGGSVMNLARDIKSASLRDREKAVVALTALFKSRNRNVAINELGDKSYHEIFEAIFSFVIREKPNFFVAKKAVTTEPRLVKCATAIRVVIDRGLPKFGRKTLLALVDHITQVLPGPRGEYVEPLLHEYAKALTQLLSYPPHVELLARREGAAWEASMDCLLDIALHHIPSEEVSLSLLQGSRDSPVPGTPQPRSTLRSTASTQAQQKTASADGSLLKDVLTGIHHGIQAGNAPVRRRFLDIADVATRVLRLKNLSLGSLQTLCFAIANQTFVSVQADEFTFAVDLAKNLLPLMSYWWRADKVSQDELIRALRNEITRALILMHLHIEHLAVQQKDPKVLRDVEELAEPLWLEYSKRSEFFRLTLSDISFSTQLPDDHFKLPLFGLRPHNIEGESSWALLQNIAHLETILERARAKTFPDRGDSEDEEQPRKKQKTRHHTTRLEVKLNDGDNGTRRTALQLIPFMVASKVLEGPEIRKLLVQSAAIAGDRDALTTSWALIACASCTLSTSARQECHDIWRQLWHLATKLISLPSTCRASCVMLHMILDFNILEYPAISEDLSSITTSADVSGPGILCDTSISLMVHLFHVRNSRLPSATQSTSCHIIRWAFLRWNPNEASYASSQAPHVPIADIVNLLHVCAGISTINSTAPIRSSGGSVAEAWRSQQERGAFSRYALLLDDAPDTLPSSSCPCALQKNGDAPSDPSSFFTSKKLILELLYPKLEDLGELCISWGQRVSDGGIQISVDRFQSFFFACLISAWLSPLFKELNSSQSSQLDSMVYDLTEKGVLAALGSVEPATFVRRMILAVRSSIPDFTTSSLSSFHAKNPTLLGILSKVQGLIEHQESQVVGETNDYMDMDDEFESQSSRASLSSTREGHLRLNAQIYLDPRAIELETKKRLDLLKIISQDPAQIGLVPQAFVAGLLELQDEELLSCQGLLIEIFHSDLVTSSDLAMLVIERLGAMVSSPSLQCCEIALTTCIEVIDGLCRIWLHENGQLKEAVGDLYHHLVKNCLPHNILSSDAQMSLARLLFTLLKEDPNYATNLGLKSCRTSFLKLLQDGPMKVKCFMAKMLPSLFELYVLMLHDDVFVDVLNNLPADPEDITGIAFRLLTLASLACRWSTLLRRCIYHIFETPGKISRSTAYGRRCIDQISASLELKSPKELFTLFSRQLLFTWLESDAVEDIPYSIFSFESLEDMLRTTQAESTGLMMMRNQDDAVSDLAKRLHTSELELLRSNFTTVLAYAMTSGSSGTSSSQTRSEERLRKKLGTKGFAEAIHSNFVDIVAILLDLIDQEDSVDKVFSKYPNLTYAAENLRTIKEMAHATSTLPPNQQPMSRAKVTIHELLRLCQNTQYQFYDLWTPAVVITIARKLLNTVHGALGSLHACSVLRKVRILICLAGPTAYDSRTLEMLLNSMREFVTDFECADDALGISQYLLTLGAPYLSQVPSFLAGYALSTLASLRVFLESSQSSTTQESQFKATMNKAREFHQWLSDYLSSYTSARFKTEQQERAFRSITEAAAKIRSSGNAERDTPESKLLLDILDDEASADELLDDNSRRVALKLLCSDFSLPAHVLDDVVATDADAVRRASTIWKSCRADGLGPNYLTWAGRVLGRSFSASGAIPHGILRETRLDEYARFALPSKGSEHALLALLQGLTMSSQSVQAGLAETALRMIVSRAMEKEDEALLVACQQSLTESMFLAAQWGSFESPPSESECLRTESGNDDCWRKSIVSEDWLSSLCLTLARSVPSSILLSALPAVVLKVHGFAENAFPFLVHLVLYYELDQQQNTKQILSEATKRWLSSGDPAAVDKQKLLINTILYLRTQEYPKESSIADRLHWLDIDHSSAAAAASRCGVYKSALLFAEIACSESNRAVSRRSSSVQELVGHDTLLEIFENIDDPDAYYGLPEEASLSNVLARAEYEREGQKTLAFRGALYDSHVRLQDGAQEADSAALANALNALGHSALSHSLLQTQQSEKNIEGSLESTFDTARRLEIWNLPAPTGSNHQAVTLYKAYQAMHQATDISTVHASICDGFSRLMGSLTEQGLNGPVLRRRLSALASLSEFDDLVNIRGVQELDSIFEKFENRSKWMKSGIYDDVSQILSSRGTAMSMLAQRSGLLESTKVPIGPVRQFEVKSLIMAGDIYRHHQATQESLRISTTLTHLVDRCALLNVHVDAVVNMEAASSLWDHGEMGSSIKMLQAVDRNSALKRQTLPVSRADLLSKIGHKMSVARLEKPQDIQKKYLEPALKELRGNGEGRDAGSVFHQFAVFCDHQLQDPDGLEDLARLQSLRQGKSDEVAGLKSLIGSTRDSQMKQRYNHILSKEKQWLELDEQELRRVEQARSEFVRLSLENYLRSLIASDGHDSDALRFTALWLEKSEEEVTSQAVAKYLPHVPTRKFASLMSQLSSRLQDQEVPFQNLLTDLVYNICVDHPYHGMYQIWSGTKAKAQQTDEVAVLRVRATEKVARRIASTKSVANAWIAVEKSSKYYHLLAMDKNQTKYKAGVKVALKDSSSAQNLVNCFTRFNVPPPTMHVKVSATKDYSHVPTTVRLEPTMSIASGVSAPKIITAVASDGRRYRQLVKGGNDDLRQDAIMEQVFAAVSDLLKLHRATQQRNLGIRTYKVLPLTATSGVIEFVPNTTPLHDFLMPAHERYYPKDLKGSQCRKEIFQVQNRTAEARIGAYRKVTEKFHPVMRYFFMENFQDPDDWFVKRLAYTRSTAAISILGHVLGLGDRHGHNILLDSKTGEAIHIDLGVAFEAGRILPVPELVPFRLTRDIVDGMGITKTEGVFRRCCEFTLDALREEQYSIMTILDVLRYDPLYTWSVSPLRLAKLQKARHADEASLLDDAEQSEVAAKAGRGKNGNINNNNNNIQTGRLNEPSEADRALEVVRKKLSKTLSVTATVNDLINQATDERNLAVLYSGWAAYA